MILNKKYVFLFSIFWSMCFAQEKKKVTLTNELKEVVVTGQLSPQSIKKSVFSVRLITAKDIQNLAAVSLSDVLTQYLNITVRPSGSSGRSTVSLFGLDAQYFKILIDGIPLANEAGFGNNTDLSQINLNDIEQIEIVEGSMGVTHGANAVSGVLNIVTKKSSQHKWEIATTLQEETVKNEFAFFDKGRHIQSLKVSNRITDNWFVNLGGNRTDFKGFLDDKKGKNYTENDQLRGFRWLPKEQFNATALLSFRKNNFTFFYKFEFFDETIDFYNSTVQSGFNTQLGSYRYANDKRYAVNRLYQNLNFTGLLATKWNYNLSLSHQKQERNLTDFRYVLQDKSKTNAATQKDQSMEVLFSTGTINHSFYDKKLDLQLGYELANNKGFSLIQEENNKIVPVNKTLNNYDFFVVSEIKATPNLAIRPGLRVSVQSLFKNQMASSLGLRYLMDKGFEVRTSFGTSFRTPNFDELYSKQIFDGHFFTGNENLVPETSTSYEMNLKKNSVLKTKMQLSNSLSSSFLNVKNRIDMALIRLNPDTENPEYQYINISNYKMWNVSSLHQFKQDNWTFSLGAAMIGISQKVENNIFGSNEKYLYSINLNSNLTYTVPSWKTTFSTYFKHNGRTQQFVESSSQYIISTIDASNWLDASIRKTFYNNRLETTLGARNLLNITNINQTKTNEGQPHPSASQILLAYGRSYFIKLTYNLNF